MIVTHLPTVDFNGKKDVCDLAFPNTACVMTYKRIGWIGGFCDEKTTFFGFWNDCVGYCVQYRPGR